MSTELPETPEMARANKKHQKNQGYTESSTKKRRREEKEEEEGEGEAADSTVDRSSKKKRKKEEHAEATESRPEKSSKKRKREEREGAKASREAGQEAPPAKKRERIIANADSEPVLTSKKKNNSSKEYVDASLLEEHSVFVQQTTSFYLPLSPCAYHFPLEGLCAEHISPLLLNYYPPLDGVLLSYQNPRMSEHPEDGAQVKSSSEAKTVLSRSIDEYAVTYVWLSAEFLLFKPKRGVMLEGIVNLQNESMLGLVCYNYFSAVIDRERLPTDWQWKSHDGEGGLPKKQRNGGMVESLGNFIDGSGLKIEGWYAFKVDDFEASGEGDGDIGTVSIFGTLLDGGGKLKNRQLQAADVEQK